jgi:hypothetical protein
MSTNQMEMFSAKGKRSRSQAKAEAKQQVLARLAAPFALSDVHWTVIQAIDDSRRGLVAPYLSVRLLLGRLNEVLGVGGWTRSYTIDHIENIAVTMKGGQVRNRTKLTAVCTLEIPGIGRNQGTGEMWADDENAMTAADAQSFKRACETFDIGAYLKRIPAQWCDLNQSKQPVITPRLFDVFPLEAFHETDREAVMKQREEVARKRNAAGDGAVSQSHAPAPAPTPSPNNGRRGGAEPQRYSQILGQTLFDDVLRHARQEISQNASKEEAGHVNRRFLEDARLMLGRVRVTAGKVPEARISKILDAYDVKTLMQIPSLDALRNILRDLLAAESQKGAA